jgi:hypothetical protein
MIVDETYANGDGTDSWCSSNAPVLSSINQGAYPEPKCFTASCHMADFRIGYGPALYTFEGPGNKACTNRDDIFPNTYFILCM